MERGIIEKAQDRIDIDLDAFPVNTVLDHLLEDKTTKRHIIFASDAYSLNGRPIDPKTEITPEILQQLGEDPIQPRCFKKPRGTGEPDPKERGSVYTGILPMNSVQVFPLGI